MNGSKISHLKVGYVNLRYFTTSASCKEFNCEVLSRVASLKEHVATSKHRYKNMKGYSGISQVCKLLTLI